MDIVFLSAKVARITSAPATAGGGFGCPAARSAPHLNTPGEIRGSGSQHRTHPETKKKKKKAAKTAAPGGETEHAKGTSAAPAAPSGSPQALPSGFLY